MGRTVGELEDSIDSAELTDWMAFYLIDPWGEQRADLRNGLLTAATINSNPFRSKGHPASKPTDFLLYPSEQVAQSRQITDPAEIEQLFFAITAAYG